MSKIAIVTGANKGIGLETCRALATSGQYAHVYLTSRSLELGQAALADVKSCTANSVKYHQLDIACSKSIKSFRDYIEENYNGFDVLVQNAGFAFKNAATESFDVQAEETLKVNFWGTLEMMKEFYPLANENARIVHVSSMASQSSQCGFTPRFGNPINRELHSINISLTLERLEELAKQFVTDCQNEENVKKGWPKTAYGVSKLLVNGITRVYGHRARSDGKGVLVNCCCPGFVKTDMSSHSDNATKDTVQGAQTSLWLAMLPAGCVGPQGTYLADA